MARFVTFPGTAGSYASTDDVNLLDADTAHIQQSQGLWVSNNNASLSVGTPPLAPPFGTTALLFTAVAETANVQIKAGPLNVVPSVDNTMSVWVLPTQAGLSGGLRSVWDSSSFGPILPLPEGVWTQLVITSTADAAPVAAETHVRLTDAAGNFTIGQGCWMAAGVLREGTDATFVPSLRIVGDLELEIDFDPTDVTAVTFISKTNFSDDRTFRWHTDGGAGLRFRISNDGTTEESLSSGEFLVAGRQRQKLTFETSGLTTFYLNDVQEGLTPTATDPVLFISDRHLEVGSYANGGAEFIEADIYLATMRDGIDGPIVAVFNPDDIII